MLMAHHVKSLEIQILIKRIIINQQTTRHAARSLSSVTTGGKDSVQDKVINLSSVEKPTLSFTLSDVSRQYDVEHLA